MKILIDDGMQIGVGTGIGKYTSYLYKYLNKNKKSEDRIDLFSFDKGNLSKKIGRLKYLMYINSKLYRNQCQSYDIIHYTNYAMPLIKARGVKYAVTIHDLASFKHPDTFSKLYGLYSRVIIRWAIKNADVLFTVSESVKNEIIERWPNASKKIHVAYPGFYDEFSEDSLGEYEHPLLKEIEDKKFFLFVGTVEKRKNVLIIFRAFEQLKNSDKDCDFKLVYAGRSGYGYNELLELISKSKYKNDVLMTGYTSTNDIRRLYQRAAAYIFPSVYEGFGSTQLECMYYHTPLILSDIPTNREISGEYGLFFDLNDLNGLVNQMLLVVKNNYAYEQKARTADIIIKNFLWSNLISKYISIYNNL